MACATLDLQGVDGLMLHDRCQTEASRRKRRGVFRFFEPFPLTRTGGRGSLPPLGLWPFGGHPVPLLPAAAVSISGMRRSRCGFPLRLFIAAAQTTGRPRSRGVCLSVLAAGPVPPRCVGVLRWAAAAPPAAAVARQPPACSTPRRGSARVEINGPLRGPPLRSLAGRARLRLSALAGCPWRVPPVALSAAAAPPGGAVAARRAALSASAPPGFVLSAVRCPGVGPPCPLPSPSPLRGPGERKRLTRGGRWPPVRCGGDAAACSFSYSNKAAPPRGFPS